MLCKNEPLRSNDMFLKEDVFSLSSVKNCEAIGFFKKVIDKSVSE